MHVGAAGHAILGHDVDLPSASFAFRNGGPSEMVDHETDSNSGWTSATEEMGAAITLSVPLEVSVGFGRSWDDAAH